MSDNTPRTPANRRAARIVTATIVAGGLALAGGTAYANANSDEKTPVAAAPVADVVTPVPEASVDTDQAFRDAFYAAGYTYDDAVVLGAQWSQDPWEAKVTGGEELQSGGTLPIEPGSSAPAEPAPELPTEESAALDAFFGAGYDYDDAVALGSVWNVDSYEAKVTGGEKLLAGETLPVAP